MKSILYALWDIVKVLTEINKTLSTSNEIFQEILEDMKWRK